MGQIMKVLQLFTDGGGFRQEDKSYIGSSGIRILLDGELLQEGSAISNPGTNQYAELRAMAVGLHEIGKLIEDVPDDYIIELYTDSEYSLMCLTQWIYGWKKRMKNGIYYSASRPPKPVLNQAIIDVAFDKLVEIRKDCQIDFFHINSHVTPSEFDKAFKRFKKYNPNKEDVSEEEFVYLMKQNDLVDKIVRTAYDEYMVDNPNMKNNKSKNITIK